jgi:urease accessory protein
MHTDDYLALLRLMQLADSALPVGAAAHSFGLETLVAEEYLEVTQLGPFLRDYLEEAGVVEGAFCRLGYRLASHTDRALFTAEWLALNEQLSAIKTARESPSIIDAHAPYVGQAHNHDHEHRIVGHTHTH